jgi:hypothetical protein
VTANASATTAGFGHHLSTWQVRIEFFEDAEQIAARAFLVNDQGAAFTTPGIGAVRHHQGAVLVPEIDEEVAASRALSALAEQLMEAALEDAADVVSRTAAARAGN